MELCKHCNLRDAGKRRLDYVDAYVEGREPKDLREPETHERANHESQMVWHRLAQHLTNKGLRLAFTGGGGEVEGKRIADVVRFLPKGSYRKFSGALSFGQTAELLRHAALYVGVDTSTTHVAAAVGVPVLALFGPTWAVIVGRRPPRVRATSQTT